jgi:serine/threonine-protein kinase
MPPDRVLRIMKQICGALDEAHNQGVIHRDLKPENIILTDLAGETDFVKVLDFGIAARSESADAKREQKLTQQGMVLGTPPYMSPEQFTGKALDVRSDVYSLGVMAYELLTARLPFDAETPWQWATQHMTAQPLPFEASAPSTSIPAPMRRAIMRALSKDREERQESARQFFADLSGGGGLTRDEPVASSSLATSGTAQMAAVPDFSGATGQAAVVAVAQAGPAVAAPPADAIPAGAALPPPPPTEASGGSRAGRLLIIGLAGLGGILLLAIVIVAVRNMKPDDEPNVTLTNPFPSSVETMAVASETPGSVQAELPDQKPGKDAGPAGTGAVAPDGRPTRSEAHPQRPSTGAPVSGSKACDQCIAAARGGNIPGAAAHYRRCNDAAKKSQCAAHAKTQAPRAARTAALNGSCSQARAIVAAASAIGAGSARLGRAAKSGSCR